MVVQFLLLGICYSSHIYLGECATVIKESSRQLQIQSNTGLPIITISSATTSSGNGTRPAIPNIQITQGPTNDWLSQPIGNVLSFFRNVLSNLLEPPNPQKVEQKQATPLVIIPVAISFPPGEEIKEEFGGADQTSPSFSSGNTEGHVGLREDTPIHTVLPILEDAVPLRSDGDVESEDLKRRRDSLEAGMNISEGQQTDAIVSHIQAIMGHLAANSSARN